MLDLLIILGYNTYLLIYLLTFRLDSANFTIRFLDIINGGNARKVSFNNWSLAWKLLKKSYRYD